MPITDTTTRADLIAAAARLVPADAPDWAGSEYEHGICALIAEATGATDAASGRSEVWAEIVAHRAAEDRRQRAKQIARDVVRDEWGDYQLDHITARPDQPLQVGGPELVAMLTAAALQALTEKESAR